MELRVHDRLLLMNLIPEIKGDIYVVRAADKLRADLVLGPMEKAALEIKQTNDGRIQWNAAMDTPVEIDIPEPLLNAFRAILVAKNNSGEGELTLEHLSLYERIVEGKTLAELEAGENTHSEEPIPEPV